MQRSAIWQKHHNQAGISLLELAIVLVIIGTLAGSALNLGSNRTGQARLTQTYDKMVTLERALGNFLRLNGRLPCPADPRQARLLGTGAANPALGAEDCTANTRVTIGGAPDVPDVFAGAIPAQALNLSPEFMLDGWDRRFTYVVEERFVTRQSFAEHVENNPLYVAPDPRAYFLSVSDGTNLATYRTRNAVMVIISFGENGQGAWSKDGGARNAVTTADVGQVRNAQNLWGGAVSATNKEFAQTMRSSSFDDILYYKKKDELIRLAGGTIQDTVCTTARMVLKPPSNRRDLDPDMALAGPIGCETAYVNNTPVLPTAGAYEALARHTNCLVRQFDLARIVGDRCLSF